jgi:uncharacterized protein
MAEIRIDTTLEFDDPVLVEGLPGVGLVGKIATDHIVETLEMTDIGHVDCDGLPKIAVYGEDSRGVEPPVRLYGDPERDLLALQSDIPVSRDTASDFASAVTDWIESMNAFPLYLSGLPLEDHDAGAVPEVFGVATGDGGEHLETHDIQLPTERGVIGGPTGALVNRAESADIDACGLVVESDPQFPDPAAARQLIVEGIEPIADISVPTDDLVDRAEDIREQKEKLAKRMQQASEDESSQAQPLRMYQ